jgi:ATP-dependent DNA helicase RecG
MATFPPVETETLRTILNMEEQKEYADVVVLGGLDKYISNWSRKIRSYIKSSDLLSRFDDLQLAESKYAAWDKQKRKLWIDDLHIWLTEFEKQISPASTKKTTVKSVKSRRIAHKTVSSGNIASQTSNELDLPITVVKGIKDSFAAKLNKLGVKTIRDILYFFPRRHIDYSRRKKISELSSSIEGEEQTVIATVWEARVIRLGKQRGTEVILGDETGNIRAIWFNQPYLAAKFSTNIELVISGKVVKDKKYQGHWMFTSPEWELVEDKELIHTGRLVPIYPLTSGLYSRQTRNLVKRVIDRWIGKLPDFLPEDIRNRCHLQKLPEAILQAHYPEDINMKITSRNRLAFDELFLIQMGVLSKKRNWQEKQPGIAFDVNLEVIERFLGTLPFELTSAQQKVLKEIIFDLQQTKPMSRLLQGDVGSGKTIIAVLALLISANNGYQGAIMAPTEILAEQHFRNISQLLSPSEAENEGYSNVCNCEWDTNNPVRIALLTGKMNDKEKTALQKQIKEGEIDVIIGTHALIQKDVEFNKLGFVVIDEQHRFGVLQRSALHQKGFNPHLLVMTATPIPRTLAMTLYGDLDISVIDEMPQGRQIIKTEWLDRNNRDRAYDFVRKQVLSGHQAFIICPLIEESENIEAKAAVAEYDRLSHDIFPDLQLGLLHGRMSGNDKDDTMQSFRDCRLDILISTPVVEVGIDVPNATIMVIEAAERFGLSQLHQFRGRVGRGKDQSYCLLISEVPSIEGIERLKSIENIHDGFQLAEKDLELRGPGEFFGTRQSGLPDLRMARLSDIKLIELAREEAISLFRKDPDLKLAENLLLAEELARVWPDNGEWS